MQFRAAGNNIAQHRLVLKHDEGAHMLVAHIRAGLTSGLNTVADLRHINGNSRVNNRL